MGVILALQSSDAVHLVVDNLTVVRHVGRLLDGHRASSPVELVDDGDLLLLSGWMLHHRGLDTVRISKVKGHADEGMVLDGRVQERDRAGVGQEVIDARRNFFLVFAVGGILLFLNCIGSSSPYLGPWLIMMGARAQLLIL